MIAEGFNHIMEYSIDYPQDTRVDKNSGELIIPAYSMMSDARVNVTVPAHKIKEFYNVLSRIVLEQA
jgi:hypothetical protein